eukprot:3798724-Rhodomonas_salina.1
MGGRDPEMRGRDLAWCSGCRPPAPPAAAAPPSGHVPPHPVTSHLIRPRHVTAHVVTSQPRHDTAHVVTSQLMWSRHSSCGHVTLGGYLTRSRHSTHVVTTHRTRGHVTAGMVTSQVTHSHADLPSLSGIEDCRGPELRCRVIVCQVTGVVTLWSRHSKHSHCQEGGRRRKEEEGGGRREEEEEGRGGRGGGRRREEDEEEEGGGGRKREEGGRGKRERKRRERTRERVE